jgi:hypothetical protein
MRYALRTLLKSPGFAAAAVLTLGLGIGANTAIFSAVDAALLRPLPFTHAENLVQIWETHPSFPHLAVAFPDYLDWMRAGSFEQMAAWGYNVFQITGQGEPEQVDGGIVSDNFLSTVGLKPALGRGFSEGETQAVLLSDALWRRKFNADPSVVGRSIRMNGASFQVVGVLPGPQLLPKDVLLLTPFGKMISDFVALAMLVLVGAALLTRSLARLTGVDPGFQVEHVLTARVALPGSYSTPAQSAAFYQQLVARMAAKPGVTAVATADATPLQSSYGHTRFAVDGEPTPEAGRYPVACIRNESPNYFEVEHVPLMAARGFTDQDATGAPGAPVVVNEALARRFFHGKAVGRSVILGVMDPKQSRFPIVGVVANTLESGLDAPPEPTIYFAGYSGSGNSAVVVIHTVGEPLAMAGVLRREVAALESQAPVSEVRTMEQIVDKSLAGRKFSAILISMFGALALALAGALVGAVAAAFAGKAIASHLYGLRASDPASFAWAAAMLLAVAMIGAWIPARRATRVDPVVALREE